MSQSRIFTEAWIESTLSRYGDREEIDQPLTYVLATHHGASIRTEIESWIVDFPESRLPALTGELRSDRGFYHAYHNLAVRHVFQSLGYDVEFEPRTDGRTPDLLVSDGKTAFLCEVFSLDTDSEQSKHERCVDYLAGLVGRIEDNACLWIRHERLGLLQREDVRPLSNAIENWLRTQPDVGDVLSLNDWDIELTRRSPVNNTATISGPCSSGFVCTERLAKNVKAKLRKYGAIVSARRIPFVIAVTPSFSSGIGIDSLDDVLFGQEQFTCWVNRATGESTPGVLSRAAGGRFGKSPELSAVMLVNRNFGRWNYVARRNPGATNPLPSELQLTGAI